MKRFWHYLKQQAWFMALPLLFMTAYGTSALAAQAPSFSATASGAANNLSVTANINVGDADVGKMGNNYVGFNFNQTWYFHNGAGWASINSGAVPIYAAAPLANRSIEVLRNQDVSDLIGGQLYVGYGLTESDMLANNKFGMVYTVTDTTAPTVTNTIHANGATNVATNTKVAVAFSETMDSSTINDANFTLKETVSTIAVTGIVSYSGVTATFIPIGNLAGNTGYTVTVKGGAHGAKDLAGNPLASDFSIGWTTGEAADVTAPTVTGTPHTNGATNVAVNTKIGATFSEGMDPLTITNANFTLRETVSGNTVAGTVSYSGVSAVFVPSSILARSTGYTVTVKGGSGGVKDLAGNPLASDFAISWTTAATTDTTAPTVTGTMNANGATNVAVNTKVGIAFSEGMDPLTVTNLNFALKETVSGKPVAGTVSYSGVNATFTPTTGLAGFTGYTVTVKGGAGGVKDLAGNPLASDRVWSWTTVVVADTTAPTVNGTMHANGATNVAVNTKVGAAFSKGMDPLTMTNVNFTLKETVSGNAVAGTVSYSGVTAIFVPLSNLADSTGYTATVKGGAGGVKDLAGNPMASDFIISWTTAAAAPDTIPPTVTNTTNANGATNVSINTKIGATFSEWVDPLTMTNVNFTLKESRTGNTIDGTVNYSGVDAAFIPFRTLAYGTEHTVTIKGGVYGVKDLAGNQLASDYVWSWTTEFVPFVPVVPVVPVLVVTAPANILGRAANFGVLVGQAGTATLTNNGGATTVNGDVGATSQTTSPTLGADYTNYKLNEQAYQDALTDMTAAITDLNSRACTTSYGADQDFGNSSLAPGVYCVTGAMSVGSTPLSLNAPGVYVFRSTGTLTSAANVTVQFTGTANAANTSVYWVPVGATTLSADNAFLGTILSSTAAITLGANTTLLNGRVMSGSAVTLSSNTITRPTP